MPTPRTIAIAGGTGFIGAEVLRHVARAHPDDHVIALAHSDASLDRLQDDGFRAVRADMTQPGTWQEHLIGADVIIQAAQPATFGRRLGRAAGRRYRSDRLSMDRHLLEAFDQSRARLVYISGNSYFGETGADRRANESMTPAPTGFGPYIQPAVREVLRRVDAGQDVVIAFPGAVYGRGAWLKQYTLDPLHAGEPVVELAGRSRVTSPVHLHDVARAVAFLADVPGARFDEVGRMYFLVDDEPMTFHEINELAARALGVQPRYRRLPAPLVRLFAGSIAVSYMRADASYSNARLKELGFTLTYPSARSGITAVLSSSAVGA